MLVSLVYTIYNKYTQPKKSNQEISSDYYSYDYLALPRRLSLKPDNFEKSEIINI